MTCLLGVLVGLSFIIQIDEVVEAHGSVESATSYSVRAASDGYIQEVNVKDGTAVHRGDPLASLTNESLANQIRDTKLSLTQLEHQRDETNEKIRYLIRSAQPTEQDKTQIALDKLHLSLDAATAEKESQQNEARRSAALLDRGLVSKRQTDYAKLQAQLSEVKEAEEKKSLAGLQRDLVALKDRQVEEIRNMRNDLERIDIQIQKTRLDISVMEKKQSLSTINAPADGMVLLGERREKLVGEFVRTGETVADLIDRDSLIFACNVGETDVRKLHDGQAVHLELNALPYQKYKVFNGRIVEISPEGERDKATGAAVYRTKIKLDDPWVNLSGEGQSDKFALKPGFSGVARIIVRPDMKFISWLSKQIFGGNA